MNNVSNLAFNLTEQGYVPDIVLRRGIRHLLKQRLKEIHADDVEYVSENISEFIQHMNSSTIALVPEKANDQHYEVPSEFFKTVLGSHLKYSCGYWPEGVDNLDQSEKAALEETAMHAKLEDGQQILDLGCGWGSLSLWIAKHYPNSQVTSVSNSNSQREFIEEQANGAGLKNIKVITCDMNEFEGEKGKYDRVVSVEMFEHMRNWKKLYEKVSNWLNQDGMFFKHVFVHRSVPYFFDDNGPSDWMSRHFFSGGMMPSDELPLHFQDNLDFVDRWRWDGQHYEKTSNAWLYQMDSNREILMPLFEKTYGSENAQAWWNRWRIFFMACAELFGYNNGQEWWVSHYLFKKK